MKDMVLVLDNIRSALNVGAIMRTAAGLGIKDIYALGRTPYPKIPGDKRLPHIAERADRQILKTALGAEEFVRVRHVEHALELIDKLKSQGYMIISIENGPTSQALSDFSGNGPAALVFGHEIDGVSDTLLEASDKILAIPMSPHKESFNVASAAAMAMYHFRFKA